MITTSITHRRLLTDSEAAELEAFADWDTILDAEGNELRDRLGAMQLVDVDRRIVKEAGWPGSEHDLPRYTSTGFTSSAKYTRCFGQNHKDTALKGTCDGCGRTVVKTDDGRVLDIKNGRGRYACWQPSHTCEFDAYWSNRYEDRDRIQSGELVKGARVKVVRGRKVKVGTTGTLIWIGSYRNENFGLRVGVRDDNGEVHWTSASNVETVAG